VIIGNNKFFSGGADIREFAPPACRPDLPEVNAQQDSMQKPLVARSRLRARRRPRAGPCLPLQDRATPLPVGLPEVKLRHPAPARRHAAPAAHHPMAEAVRLMTTGAMLPWKKRRSSVCRSREEHCGPQRLRLGLHEASKADALLLAAFVEGSVAAEHVATASRILTGALRR